MEKAYDYVNWKFVEYMLRRMGFGQKWQGWMNQCMTTSFAVLVNGGPSKFFGVFRGLRQGDPLSPLLFIIIMEALNGLLTRAVGLQLVKG